ncbi:MAG: Protein TolB [Verrucomicrobiales bacterium]|nr:Protein TolB [Verrucomicrobiales bacterium]
MLLLSPVAVSAAAETDGVKPIWMASGPFGGVSDLGFSSNGEYLVQSANSVRVWRWADKALVNTFSQGRAVFSGDASQLATVMEVSNNVFALNVWRRADSFSLRTFTSESNNTAMALSPDDSLLALSSPIFPYGSIRIRRFSDGTLVRTLVGHTSQVRSVAFSSDGTLLLSVGNDKTVRLWRVSDGLLLQTILHASSVFTACISSDNAYIASATTVPNLNIWDGRSGALRTNLNLDTYGLTFSPDGAILAAGSSDHTIKLYSTTNWAIRATLTGHTTPPATLRFNPSGSTLCSAGYSLDGAIRLWSVHDQQQIGTLGESTESIGSMAIASDGSVLASGCASDDGDRPPRHDFLVRLWEQATGKLLFRLPGHSDEVIALSISTNGILASGSWDTTVRLWNTHNGEALQTLARHTGAVWGVAFTRDGSNVFSGSADRSILRWRVADGSYLQTLSGHGDEVRSLAASPDGLLLASASFDQTIRLWRVSDGAAVRTIPVPGDYLQAVVFSPDGSLVAASGNRGDAHIFRVSDGALVNRFAEISVGYVSLAFSPDSSVLAAGVAEIDPVLTYGAVSALRMWRVSDWNEIGHYRREVFGIGPLVFSPDGYGIAYGRFDGTIVMGRSSFGGLPRFISSKSVPGTTQLQWQGGAGQYQLQSRTNLSQGLWQNVGASTSVQSNRVSVTNQNSFFRVRSGP